MPALLKVFSSTPAVVRKRATELLEVIRGAVKEALGSANKAQGGLTSVVKPKPVTVPAPPTTSVVSSTNMGTELLWGQGGIRSTHISGLLKHPWQSQPKAR